MKDIDNLILAYVPEADQMSFEEAAKLAIERDAQAAAAFLDSIGVSQFNVEAAARACNDALDAHFEPAIFFFP